MDIGAYVAPAPNPEVEERVRGELKALDPLLDILWQNFWTWNPRQQELEGRYVLICYWPDADPRRADRDQVAQRPYDIMGMFSTNPGDYSSVPEDPESVLELVLQHLGQCDDNRIPHAKRMKQIQEHNKSQRAKDKQAYLEKVEEQGDQSFSEFYKPTQVRGEDFNNG